MGAAAVRSASGGQGKQLSVFVDTGKSCAERLWAERLQRTSPRGGGGATARSPLPAQPAAPDLGRAQRSASSS